MDGRDVDRGRGEGSRPSPELHRQRRPRRGLGRGARRPWSRRRTPKLLIYIAPSTPLAKIPGGMPDRMKPTVDEVVAYDDQDRDYLPLEAAVNWSTDGSTRRSRDGRRPSSCTRPTAAAIPARGRPECRAPTSTAPRTRSSPVKAWTVDAHLGVEPIAFPTVARRNWKRRSSWSSLLRARREVA